MGIIGRPLIVGSGGGGSATLITKSITANGTYNASSDNADGYSSVTVNVGGSTAKLVLAYSGYESVSATAYTATSVSVTIPKNGTYNVSWFGARSSTSGTSGSRLYRTRSGTDTAIGDAVTTFELTTQCQYVLLENQSFNKDDILVVRARSRTASYAMTVGNLIVEEV